ncbi:hypothetical protein RSPO_c01947 [Ralstonia solanacearum Po82]|uniref:Uncharacterized protein n=1 Tax=Ralstonia solanacearum (strain Po82) TaxID=1031711 RepID=F6G1W3_RALS8|nr:hypothetical protein RSPO_c01947 [Ralstonia solanacearum Po82]
MASARGFHVKLPIVFQVVPAPGAMSRSHMRHGRRYRSEEV